MKKFKNSALFALIILIASVLSITSCKKDSTADKSPSINFIGGNNFTSTDKSVAVGTIINIGINASSNTNTGTKLKEVIFTLTYNNTPQILGDTLINTTSFTNSGELPVNWTGTARISIKVIDKDGESSEVALNITGTTTGAPLTSYAALQMGGASSTFGSYLDAETGSVYTLTQINADATKKAAVDIVFNNGLFQNSATVISNTGTKFATTTLSATDFASTTNDATFGTYSASATLNQINVSAGSVVYFVTKSGKGGLLYVLNIANGDIVVSEKIQQ